MPVQYIKSAYCKKYYDGYPSPPPGAEEFEDPRLRTYWVTAWIPATAEDGRLQTFRLYSTLGTVVDSIPPPVDSATTGITAPAVLALPELIHDALITALSISACRIEVMADEVVGTTYSTLPADEVS